MFTELLPCAKVLDLQHVYGCEVRVDPQVTQDHVRFKNYIPLVAITNLGNTRTVIFGGHKAYVEARNHSADVAALGNFRSIAVHKSEDSVCMLMAPNVKHGPIARLKWRFGKKPAVQVVIGVHSDTEVID